MMEEECVIAVDLGGTNLRVATVRGNGEITDHINHQIDWEVCSNNESLVHLIISKILEILGGQYDLIKGIGISAPGIVNLESNIQNPANIPLTTINLKRPLEEHFRCPVIVINDCNAGIIGEYIFGQISDFNTIVYLTFSTGIGAGIISDGKVFSGDSGRAGEVGHITIDTKYNLPCSCGELGHWEAYCSGKGLPVFFNVWKKMNGISDKKVNEISCLTPKMILDSAEQNEQPALDFIDEISKINGRGLDIINLVYNPSIIIIDGSVARNHPETIINSLTKYSKTLQKTPIIKITSLNGNAPLLGAAYAVSSFVTGEDGIHVL